MGVILLEMNVLAAWCADRYGVVNDISLLKYSMLWLMLMYVNHRRTISLGASLYRVVQMDCLV